MGEIVRKRLRFHGWVQGVGFRYRARHAASLAGATGWVCNEPDGSVTMEIQAEEARIDEVIQMIGRGAYIQIERMEVRALPVDPNERGFHAE